MIDDRRETGGLRRGNLWIGRRQRYRAHRLESYAVVHLVEPDQRLALAVRAIFPGVDFDEFVRAAFGCPLQGLLNVVSGKDMVALFAQSQPPAR